MNCLPCMETFLWLPVLTKKILLKVTLRCFGDRFFRIYVMHVNCCLPKNVPMDVLTSILLRQCSVVHGFITQVCIAMEQVLQTWLARYINLWHLFNCPMEQHWPKRMLLPTSMIVWTILVINWLTTSARCGLILIIRWLKTILIPKVKDWHGWRMIMPSIQKHCSLSSLISWLLGRLQSVMLMVLPFTSVFVVVRIMLTHSHSDRDGVQDLLLQTL